MNDIGQTQQEQKLDFSTVTRFIALIISGMLLLSVLPGLSYNPAEIATVRGGTENIVYCTNIFGRAGTFAAWWLLITFGLAVYPMLLLLFTSCLRRTVWRRNLNNGTWDYISAFPIAGFGIALLLGIRPGYLSFITGYLNLHSMPGGVIGQKLSSPAGIFTVFMNSWGSALLALILIAVSIAVIFYYDWSGLFRKKDETLTAREAEADEPPAHRNFPAEQGQVPPRMRPQPRQEQEEQNQPEALPIRNTEPGEYEFPPLSLLDNEDNSSSLGANALEIERNKQTIQDTMRTFQIDAEVTNAISGPQVTLFEMTTAANVRLNRITQLEDNILKDLSAQSIRILAPIPGKNMVGIEVPNATRAVVSVKSLMQDKAWTSSKDAIPLLIGKNISGKTIILDLARAPHLLVAGTTGSGKSVCMNLLITSLLFKFSPEDLRLIMVDPKVVEFAAYSSLPHLITPIVNDTSKVGIALNWVVNEMERRRPILAKAGVRDLLSYNRRPRTGEEILDDNGEPLPDKLPYIVVIIDELADIMATSRQEVENCLSRIAAKSRAFGIHTIIATQRPDVKVLTGTIKSNYPVRIAFKVASHTDSQTIINTKGAENLLGYGDMLFVPPGASNLERIQCGKASDEELKRVVDFVSERAEQHFDETVMLNGNTDEDENDDAPAGSSSEHPAGSKEDLIQRAIEIILRDRRPTVSYIQRSLGIGYNKSADIMDELERRGVVGPQIGTAPRQILISSAKSTQDFDEDDF